MRQKQFLIYRKIEGEKVSSGMRKLEGKGVSAKMNRKRLCKTGNFLMIGNSFMLS